MEVVKVIPQLFYDLISRVVPGGVAIVALSAALDINLDELLPTLFQNVLPLAGLQFILVIVFLIVAYVVGQILAPVSDLYERKVVAKLFPKFFRVLEDAVSASESRYSPGVRHFLSEELELNGERDGEGLRNSQFRMAIFVWCDWLRMYKPDAGARVAKIRAEYRMYGEIAVALLLSLAVHIVAVREQLVGVNVWLEVIAILGISLSSWGLARTYRTFEWSTINNYYVAKAGSKTGK